MLCQGRTATIRRRRLTTEPEAQPRLAQKKGQWLLVTQFPLVWVSVISAVASQAPLSVVTEHIRFRVVKNR